MANYSNIPVLSKIKIGSQTYWLKDADARTLLDGIIETTIPGLDARLEVLETDPTTKTYVDTQDAATLASANAYTDEQIGSAIKLKFEIVTELPTADEAHSFNKSKTIYLKNVSTKTQDVYEEYICIKPEGQSSYIWEKIGNTKIDLNDYYTKTEVDAIVADLEQADTDLGERIDGVETDLEALDGRVEAVEEKVETIEGKPAYNITTDDISNWNNEIGAKASAEQVASDLSDEVTARESADQDLDAKIDGVASDLETLEGTVSGIDTRLETAETKLEGIEDGAQVNVIEGIKLNGSQVTPVDKIVDLGNIATTESVVANVSYSNGTLKQTKGSTTTNVHEFGALADKSTGSVAGQTISGVKATGSLSGTATIDTTEVSASKVKTSGQVPSFTYGAFTPNTPTAIDVSKFNGGSQASFTEGTFTPASLTYASSDEFVKEGIKAHVGVASASEDVECLYFEDVTNKGTASVISAFSGGSKAADSFTANTVASLGSGFYTAGTAASKVEDTFDAGEMPTFDTVKADKIGDNNTVAIDNASLNVGNIVVAEKDVDFE